MNDTRMLWVSFLSLNPENVVIVLSKDIKSASIGTLFEHCNEEGQPKFVRQVNSSFSFSPLPKSQLEELGCDTVIYLLKNRDSFKSIQRKIHSAWDCKVEEYSVFPGWRNPRWFVPRERSLWLGKMSRMIQPTKLIAKIAVTIFRIFKLFGRTHYLFPSRLIIAYKNKSSFTELFGELVADSRPGIVYTGSFGPLQKFTLEMIGKDERIIAYAKFGHSPLSYNAINNERKNLGKLTKLPLTKLLYPELINVKLPKEINSRIIVIKKLEGGKPLKKITDAVVSGLAEISRATLVTSSLRFEEYTNTLTRSLQDLNYSDLHHEYKKKMDNVITILHNISTLSENFAMLPFCLSHGDFTRWNVRADHDKIYIIDWEEMAMRPIGHDLLSFLLAEYLLVSEYDPKRVVLLLIKEIYNGTLDKYLNKINTTKKLFKNDKTLIGILFLSEVFRSNLWYIQMHSNHKYPDKYSLQELIKTSWICLSKLSQELNNEWKITDEGMRGL